jgi:hypothetical protein
VKILAKEKAQSSLVVLSSYTRNKNAIVALKKYSHPNTKELEAAMSSIAAILSDYFESLKGELVYLLLVPNAEPLTEPHLLPVVKDALQAFPNVNLMEDKNLLRRLPGQVATHLSSGAPRNFEQRKGIPF